MSPYRARWRTATRHLPAPGGRQVAAVLLCCFGVAAFLGPRPGVAAAVGYFTAQGLVFGLIAAVVFVRGARWFR